MRSLVSKSKASTSITSVGFRILRLRADYRRDGQVVGTAYQRLRSKLRSGTGNISCSREDIQLGVCVISWATVDA